jgi:dihydrofolate reductase
MITLYNVISEDGYIATEDGKEDFIPDETWSETLSLFKEYDALVFGRKTYESIQKYPTELLEPFEEMDIKKIIVTRDKNFRPKFGCEVLNTPKEILNYENVLVSSGPTLNNYLIEKNLVNKVILRKIPISIGEGVLSNAQLHPNEARF